MSRKQTKKTKAAPRKDLKAAAVAAALSLAASKGWAQVSLRDIADECGVKLSVLHEHFEDKGDILTTYGRMVDRRVLNQAEEMEPGTAPRDRLFDLLMDRFDILGEHKEGLISILESFKVDPKQAVIALAHIPRSMLWMMEAVGMESHGPRGAIMAAGLTAVYAATLMVWMKDETADLSKTMAALDKNLSRAESFSSLAGCNIT